MGCKREKRRMAHTQIMVAKERLKLTTAEVMEKMRRADLSKLVIPGRNKGERGQALELILGIPNSSALTDLEDGELKTFTVGESIAVTQMGHCLEEVINGQVSFTDSKIGEKLRQTIYVAFNRAGQYAGSRLLSQETDAEHYRVLEEDYDAICDALRRAYANNMRIGTTNGPNNLLQIRTKASKNTAGGYTPMVYKGVELQNKVMAFYLKADFGKKLVQK